MSTTTKSGGIYLGVDIGGTKILLVLVDTSQDSRPLLAEKRRPTGEHFTLQDAEEFIRSFLKENNDKKLSGVGVAIPGLVDKDGKVVFTIDVPKLHGWVPASMPEFSGLPVVVLNDGKMAAVETTYNASPEELIVTLVVGTGVGSSYLINGKTLLGKNGWAGEIGGCPIGAMVPIDLRAGGKYLLRDRMGGITAEQMLALVEKNDTNALSAIKEYGGNFGVLIATVINIFNPHKISIGGGTLRWPGYWEEALEKAKQFGIPDLFNECKIERNPHGHRIVAMGAVRAGELANRKT